jgi:hypothetical protein
MPGTGLVSRATMTGKDWNEQDSTRSKDKEEIAAYLEGMGETLFDSKAQNINRYGLNLRILAQSGLQNMIKIPLNDGRAYTDIGLSTILFTQG